MNVVFRRNMCLKIISLTSFLSECFRFDNNKKISILKLENQTF